MPRSGRPSCDLLAKQAGRQKRGGVICGSPRGALTGAERCLARRRAAGRQPPSALLLRVSTAPRQPAAAPTRAAVLAEGHPPELLYLLKSTRSPAATPMSTSSPTAITAEGGGAAQRAGRLLPPSRQQQCRVERSTAMPAQPQVVSASRSTPAATAPASGPGGGHATRAGARRGAHPCPQWRPACCGPRRWAPAGCRPPSCSPPPEASPAAGRPEGTSAGTRGCAVGAHTALRALARGRRGKLWLWLHLPAGALARPQGRGRFM